MDLIAPEPQLLDLLLAGNHVGLATLREQRARATVVQREFSGVGFFTHFSVDESCPRLPIGRWVIQDVAFSHPTLEYGGGALLFIVDGALSMLEAFTYGSEPWPENPGVFATEYLTRAFRGEDGYSLVEAPSRELDWISEDYVAALERRGAG